MGTSNQWKPILKERTEEKGEGESNIQTGGFILAYTSVAKGKGAD
jgi:hypothetical protein